MSLPISPIGELLARGTAHEVVAQSGLSTWIVTGTDLHRLATKLETCDGIDMVAPFGTELHVSGRDKHALDAAIEAAKKADGAHHWMRGEPSLEDVFILLMDTVQGQFRMSTPANNGSVNRDPGFLRRTWAMIVKEFVQMRRDRMTFASMMLVPVLQLTLFGYAINTDPRSTFRRWC